MANIDYDGIRANKYNHWPNKHIRINGHEYIIQCPSKIDQDTVFYVAGRGAGGISDTDSTFAAARGKNVIVIAPVHEDGGPFPTTVDVINQLAKAYGIEPRASFSGHSNSGTLCLETAVKYIKTNNTPTTLVLNDPSVLNNSDYKIDYSALKGSLIVTFSPSSGGCTHGFMNRLKKAAACGASVIICKYNGTHGAADDVAAAMGSYDIDNMQFVGSGTYEYCGSTYKTNYTYQWIDEKGRVHDFDTVEEAQAYMEDALVGITGSLYEKCDTLEEFASKYKGTSNTLASNLSFVSNSMNGLKSSITAHQDINYQPSKTGEAGIIGTMYSATNYYGAVTNKLYGNLSAEADTVYAIANAIYKMDGCGAAIAESGLTDSMKGMFSSSSLNSNVEQLKKTSSELFENAKSAVMASGRYDELTGILGSQITPGGVGSISITALESAINAVVPSLNAEVEKATQLKTGVTDFMAGIGASNILQGGVWEDVEKNMSNYQNLLDANSKAATFISDTLKTAMGMITNYIEEASASISAVSGTEYSGLASAGELDDSKLAEITAALTQLKTNIETVEAKITEMENAKKNVCDPLPEDAAEDAVPNCYDVNIYAASEIQPYKDELENYKEVQEILTTYQGKLEGLAPVVQAAQEIIQSAVDQVKNMYENPVTDANGNQSFVADFKLDLSPYSEFLDTTVDYKQLIDDYYNKMNPPEDTKNLEETPVDEDDKTYWVDDTGSTSPENTTEQEPPSEGETEVETEAEEISTEEEPEPTDPVTPTPTTPSTTPSDESKPEQPTVVEIVDEIITDIDGDGNQNSHNNVSFLSNDVDETIEFIDTEPMIDLEEEIPNEYLEDEVVEPVVIDDLTSNEPTDENIKMNTKTMGIASGIGLALGAAALGAHSIIKSKEEKEDEDKDYGFEK